MQKWIYLFGSFGIIHGYAVFWRWRIQAEKRRAGCQEPGLESRSWRQRAHQEVLIDEQSRAAGLAGMLRAGRSAARAGHIDKFSKSRFLLLTLVGAFAGFLVGVKARKRLAIRSSGSRDWRILLEARFPGCTVRNTATNAWRPLKISFPTPSIFWPARVRSEHNAFSIALEMLGAEASEPLKSEVLKVTREMALGANLEDALHGLIARIPLLEIRMFVAAVLLQRETGGNLSEVLGKLAISVRERLRLQGQVMAASGQGRLTAKILTFLPVVLLGILEVISPAYLNNLTREPLGRNLLGIAIVSQIMGYLVMQRMIKVEV